MTNTREQMMKRVRVESAQGPVEEPATGIVVERRAHLQRRPAHADPPLAVWFRVRYVVRQV